MKKIILLVFLSFFCFEMQAQKANLFTIPNQSAQFIRMPSRATAIDIDAVFFNPANLPSLGSGFQIGISNQILNQYSELETDYQLYTDHPKTYSGNVKSFIFPSVHLNWNLKKASFHGAFIIAGGAGGVDYANLPVSDRGIADVPAAISNSDFQVAPSLIMLDAQILNNTGSDPMYSNIADYRYTFQNKGLGFSPGFQFGTSYKFNKYFSGGIDFRFVTQSFTSEGEVSNIQILPNTSNSNLNEWVAPGDYLRQIGVEENLDVYDFIAGVYDGLSQDRFINIRQKSSISFKNGEGFTFIPSVLINPTEKLFIALKYEHRTKMTLVTLVRNGADGGEQNGRAVFIDGEEIRSDIPGFISGGIGYQFTDRWRLNVGGRYMFVKGANFAGREQLVDKNYYEIEIATEYKIGKRFLVSGGYTYNQIGVQKEYHNDVDFWIPGHTFGFGGRVDFTKSLSFDAGFMYTKNVTQDFTYTDHAYADGFELANPKPVGYDNSYTMKYKKHSFIIGLGLSIKILNDKNKSEIQEGNDSGEDTPFNFRG